MIFPYPVSINAAAAQNEPAAPASPATVPWEMNGATWAGRGDQFINDSSLTGSGAGESVSRWENLVDGSTVNITQNSAGIYPTSRIQNEVTGVDFGSGISLDDWDNTSTVDQYIANDEWHVFAVAYFDIIDNSSETLGHSLIALENGTTIQNLGFGIFTKSISGQKRVVGYFYNGTSQFAVTQSVGEDEFLMVEFYGQGGTMGIRVNASSSVETSYSGQLSNADTWGIRVGSKNFNGGWDNNTNRLFEMSFANQKNADVSEVRNYFATRYGVSV